MSQRYDKIPLSSITSKLYHIFYISECVNTSKKKKRSSFHNRSFNPCVEPEGRLVVCLSEVLAQVQVSLCLFITGYCQQ